MTNTYNALRFTKGFICHWCGDPIKGSDEIIKILGYHRLTDGRQKYRKPTNDRIDYHRPCWYEQVDTWDKHKEAWDKQVEASSNKQAETSGSKQAEAASNKKAEVSGTKQAKEFEKQAMPSDYPTGVAIADFIN